VAELHLFEKEENGMKTLWKAPSLGTSKSALYEPKLYWKPVPNAALNEERVPVLFTV
jgi:hypothetical protein